MAIATYRGEKSVSELADKLFARLTPAQRTKAEAALVKANPQLTDIAKLRDGAVLHVPNLPELTPKATRTLENPAAQIAKDLTTALGGYNSQLGESIKAEQKTAKDQAALIKSARFKKIVAEVPNLQTLAEAAGKALDARVKELADRQKSADKAIKKAIADLDEQFK